jgi:glyoxalase family protein
MPGRGLHHITAVSTNISRNMAFYTGVLGLRLVKRTVAHEDPGAHHLFYGGRRGVPGTLLSFFAWTGASAGMRGVGEAEQIDFAVGSDSLSWWEKRLTEAAIDFRRERTAFEEDSLVLADPDGTPLALVASSMPDAMQWDHSAIPVASRIHGIGGLTLNVRRASKMAAILVDVLGFSEIARAGGQLALAAHRSSGGRICLHESGAQTRGRVGAGTIHHVAFRARDASDQAAMAERLRSHYDIAVSVGKDRSYYHSIHFRGPDGILVEIATDGPGFLIDEQVEVLGKHLVLPRFLEPRRGELERLLPPLQSDPGGETGEDP